MSYEPLQFVDSLDTDKHIVLFYDEPEWAWTIEFRFINNGLLKGENCIYATHGDANVIEDAMIKYGIDVEGFKKENLLHVYDIPNPMDDTETPARAAEKLWEYIMTDSKPPFRIVTRLVPDVSTEKAISVELDMEHNIHARYHDFNGSLICPYHVNKIAEKERGRWIIGLLQNHHAVIFAPKFGKGKAFNMR
jgi:hypothetical protein